MSLDPLKSGLVNSILPPETQVSGPAPSPQAFRLPDSPRVSFASLGQGKKEVLIEHQGQLYRLRETRNGKLILNK